MRCNEIAPYLEDLLDGELGEAAPPVQEHLASCPECRRRLEWLAASREAFRSLPPERPRNGFDRRLADRIAVETGAEVLPRRGEVWRRPAVQWALAASLLIAVLGGSLFFKGPLAPPSPPERTADERVAEVTEEAPPAPAPVQATPQATPAPPEPRGVEPRPIREEARPAQLRAARRAETQPARREAPVPPPAPEYLEEDRMAGLDAPPTLGYVQAQDLPVSFRCQLDSNQEGCGLRATAQTECGGFGECDGAGYDAVALAADLSDVVTTD